jgi:oligopeptidase B
MLLYGYGSYGICDDTHFSPNILPLLNRGFIYAVAHVRGGGECGQWWYEMGKLDKKENSFSDFSTVAHYFIRNGMTTSDQLFAHGRSAGGLLMGAIINKEPDLFRAVIANVPFVDVLTTMLDPSLPLSIGEREEWGDPRNKMYYDIIKKYSPYDNIKKRDYPPLFVTTCLNDPRVGFWEPVKWVQALRNASPTNKVYLRTEMTGHKGGTSRSSTLKEKTDHILFLLNFL